MHYKAIIFLIILRYVIKNFQNGKVVFHFEKEKTGNIFKKRLLNQSLQPIIFLLTGEK